MKLSEQRDFWTKAEKKKWREWCDNLRSAHPAALPYRIRRRPLADMTKGVCIIGHERGKPVFRITIAVWLSLHDAWEVLMHEAAHAIAWGKDGDVDHGPAWGEAFAAIYRDNHHDADHEPEDE